MCALCVCATLPVRAEEPPPFPDFTFKRIKPPAPGTRHRITVQITDPDTAPAGDEVGPGSGAAKGGVQGVAGRTRQGDATAVDGAAASWFWDRVSPELAAASPARLDAVAAALQSAPAGFAPPAMQDLVAVAADHGADFLRASVESGISPAMLLALASVESGGDAHARSRAGAQGVMQLMPDTAARYGVTDPEDAAQSIRGGALHLAHLLSRLGGDPVLALAAYNAGLTAVLQAQGVPNYPETRAYVPRVLAAWDVARRLCVTPPELISDGCVFATDVVSNR